MDDQMSMLFGFHPRPRQGQASEGPAAHTSSASLWVSVCRDTFLLDTWNTLSSSPITLLYVSKIVFQMFFIQFDNMNQDPDNIHALAQ